MFESLRQFKDRPYFWLGLILGIALFAVVRAIL